MTALFYCDIIKEKGLKIMVVKIRFDGLIFVGLTKGQIDDVLYHADGCKVLMDESGGVQVNGKAGDLFVLLYKLSATYDIELI